GGELLDLDEISVARTAIAHAGSVGFRHLALADCEGAAPIGRPGAVVITDDGFSLAVAESDVVGGHGRPSLEAGGNLAQRTPSGYPSRWASYRAPLWSRNAKSMEKFPRWAR